MNHRFLSVTTAAALLIGANLRSAHAVPNVSATQSATDPSIAVQAAGRGKPYLNLQDGKEMQVEYVGDPTLREALRSGQAAPRALAAADLDRNGTPDLVAGYAYDGGGIVTIQRGNPDAFAPQDDAVFARMQQDFNPDSLLPTAEIYQIPEAVDFVEVGDFNHDNRKDIMVAARGGHLFLLAGDGHGRFRTAEQIAFSGTVTSMTAGEFCAPDGWTDLAVGVAGPSGAELFIYDGVNGVAGTPMRLVLTAAATAVEFGEMDSSPFNGVAVAIGNQIEIVHGWGRKQSPPLQSQIETIDAVGSVRGLAVGFFIWNRDGSKQIAALAEDGTLRILQWGQPSAQPFSDAEIAERAKGRLKQRKAEVDVETVPGWHAAGAVPWTKVREIATGDVVGVDATSQNLLRRAHVSFVGTDDLFLLGARAQRLNIVRQVDATAGPQANVPTTAGDLVTISLETAGAPATALALPQKLNGARDLFLLQAGSASPAVIPSAPAATITVDRTDDPSGAGLTAASACTAAANDCSLRGAVQFANANSGTTISLPANTYILSINGANGCVNENNSTGNTIGDLEINTTTTVTGAGAASTIIRQAAATNDRVICMDVPLAPGFTFSFSGLTITGGRDVNSNVGGGGFIGGARSTTLNVTNVTFANNQTTGANISGGGGVAVTGGNMNVTNCVFGAANLPGANRNDLTLGNASNSNSGGGLSYSAGDPLGVGGATGALVVNGTTFTHNTSSSGSAGGGGADVFDFNTSTGTSNFSGSTFISNQATGTASGGGLNNESTTLTLATSSFTSNSAGNRGGAVYVGGGSTLLDGTNPSLTFTGNSAVSGGTSISTASLVTVAGTNMTLDGSIEVSGNGTWTNNGSTLAPTDIVIAGGTFNCSSSTMNVSGNLTVGPSGNNVIPGTFNGNTGTVNIAGNLVTSSVAGTTFNAGTGTFNFNGGVSKSISGTLSPTFNNLTVTKTGGATLTLSMIAPVAGNLTVTSGIFDLQGNTINRTAAGGTLTVSNGATLKIGGTNPLPTNYSAHSIGGTSTIEYSGANQTVSTLNSAQTYGNLTISGTGTKTLQGAISVATKLAINAATLDVSASNFALNIGGDFTNNVAAANFNPRSGTVTFNGAVAQNINGTANPQTFSSLTSNRTGAGNLVLGSNITVNGALTLTSGNIATNANTISIGSAGTRSRTSGHILGNEKKTFGGAGGFTFDVGTANGYSPVDTNVTTGTGGLTVAAVQGAQPNVVASRSLQRYWTLTEGGAGITANLVFHYLDPSDVMGNEANYQVLQVAGGARNYFVNNCPAPCVDGAANTFTINGVTNFSDWTAGEARADLQVTSVTDAPDPVIVGNNITYTINFINNGPDTSSNVTVTDAVPANTIFVSASMPAGWSRTDVVPVGGTGSIVFAKGSVASAETAILQVVANVNSNATGGSTITNSAVTASAITTDSTAGNNTGTATTLVHTPPAITSVNNATFVAGSAGTFTVTTTGFPAPTIVQGGVALPSGVTFTSNGDGTGTLSGTPAAGTGGTYAITFTASNVAGSTPAQNFTLTVNEAPEVTSANSTTFTVGTNGNFQLTASGFPTTFTFTNTGNALPGGVTLSSAGVLSGTPDAGTGGVYNLTFTVSNGVAPAGTQSFTLTINTPPIAGPDQLGTPKNTAVNAPLSKLTLNDSDPDAGDTINITGVSAASAQGGTLTLGANAITYTPANNFVGQDTFTYVLSDTRGGTAVGLVTVEVGINSALNIISITQSPAEVVLECAGIPGESYIVQASATVNGTYTDLSGPITADNHGSFEYHDTTQPQPAQRFYKVRSNP